VIRAEQKEKQQEIRDNIRKDRAAKSGAGLGVTGGEQRAAEAGRLRRILASRYQAANARPG
jgi:hypothetical protein